MIYAEATRYALNLTIMPLQPRYSLEYRAGLYRRFRQLQRLLEELRGRPLSDPTIMLINQEIELLNTMPESGLAWSRQLKRTRRNILRIISRRMQLVPRYYYRNTWLGLGMAAFGLPLGLLLASSFDSMHFMALGLSLGTIVGYGLGVHLDQQAWEHGRQLDFELRL